MIFLTDQKQTSMLSLYSDQLYYLFHYIPMTADLLIYTGLMKLSLFFMFGEVFNYLLLGWCGVRTRVREGLEGAKESIISAEILIGKDKDVSFRLLSATVSARSMLFFNKLSTLRLSRDSNGRFTSD